MNSLSCIVLMAYIKELIDSLFDEESEGNIESFKKLIYLAVNEPKLFAAHALELAGMICPVLHCIDDNTTKIYALQLLAELATNYREAIPAATYDFPQVVALLSDENAEVRKAAHYLLLIFIKKYERIDEIVKGYLAKVRESPDQWKQIQKIIHSFQSLLVIEPKCLTYPLDFTPLDDFLRLVLASRIHTHALIQKASEQTVASFVKNEYTPKILHKLDKVITQELVAIADKLGVSLAVRGQEPQARSAARERSELETLLESIQQEQDWKNKSDTVEQIAKKLQGEPRPQLPTSLVQRVLDLTYDYNFKICITAMNILLTLVVRYPQETASKLPRVEDIMVEKICDLKMAVRQIASKVLRKIFAVPGKDWGKKLLAKLSTCSVVGKQQILNFLQEHYGSQPASDLGLLLGQVAAQLSNENTKIKIKTLDCLVRISMASNTEQCKFILQKRLNKVYYDMFLDRLRERSAPEPPRQEKWEDNKNPNLNKGLTWQAERSPALSEPPNDRFLTKVEFARKVQKPQEDTAYEFRYEPPAFGGVERKEEKKGMMGTSNSSNDAFSNFQNRVEIEPKFTKKINGQNYRPSALSNVNVEPEERPEEKRLPLKPKPVKKSAEQTKEQQSNLVIKSREYRTKNDEVREQRQKSVKARTIKREQKAQKPEKTEERDLDRSAKSQMDKSSKQPFSIKKSTSRKDHQVDYKATQYVSKEELAPFSNPKQMLKQIMANLPKDADWSKQFDSLDGLRRLIKNHEEIYPAIRQNLPAILPEVLKLVESLRSSLAKNGMITLAEMCQTFKKAMDPFLQAIFVKLLRKALDTNAFIIQQVNKCITSLCNYCSTPKIVSIVITNSQTKAIPIKLKVALVMDRLMSKDGYAIGLIRDNPKVIGVMGSYVTDGSQEVRNMVRDLFLNLLGNNSQAEVEAIFRKSPKEVWEKWRTILDKDLR